MKNTASPSTFPSKPRSSFVERTLVELNHTLEQSLFAESVARKPGLLQRLDPRLKLGALLLILITINFSRSLPILAVLLGCVVLLAGLSQVPLGAFMRRIAAVTAVFTGIIALPALFLTPGPALVSLPFQLIITRSGALSALYLFLRSSASVALAVLFVLTTPWNTSLKALGVLHVPDVLILTLGMTYRYIHLLLHQANDMFLSRKSRILRLLNREEEQRLLGASTGVLLTKSLQMSSEVYLAMESRGYRGYPRTLDNFKMQRRDWAAALLILVLCSAALWFGK